HRVEVIAQMAVRAVVIPTDTDVRLQGETARGVAVFPEFDESTDAGFRKEVVAAGLVERCVVVQNATAGRDVRSEHARAIDDVQNIARGRHQAQMTRVVLILQTYRVEVHVEGPGGGEVITEGEPVDPVVLLCVAFAAGDDAADLRTDIELPGL